MSILLFDCKYAPLKFNKKNTHSVYTCDYVILFSANFEAFFLFGLKMKKKKIFFSHSFARFVEHRGRLHLCETRNK